MCQYLVNEIPNVEDLSYLELGYYHGNNFSAIRCKDKTSVDILVPPQGIAPPTHLMTTDDFFASIPKDKKWDIIYIDACHDIDNVVRDFNNSVDHLNPNGRIFCHDLIPPDEEHTKPWFCGDAYKLLYHYLEEIRIPLPFQTPTTVKSLQRSDGDYGLTLFENPEYIPQGIVNATYSEFISLLNQSNIEFSREEIKEHLRRSQ